MASLSDVSRYLRQRRAIGKPVTAADRKAAWNAYFETEASKSLARSSLALDRRRVDISERTAAESLGLQREQIESAGEAAKIQGITQLGMLGFQASETELGKKAISGVTDLFSTGKTVAPIGAQGAAVSTLAPTTTMGVSGAAVPAADAAALTSTAAPTGATALSTGLAAAGYGLAGRTIGEAISGDKKAGDIGTGAGIGFSVAGPPGAVLGAVIGGYGEKAIKESIRPLKQAGAFVAKVFGTWLCTETKKLAGFTEDEWNGIAFFREYAKEAHLNWLEWYVNIGPELLEAINGDAEFYHKLKHTFLVPVINMTYGGYPEAAYLAYKEIVISLVKEHKPELLESAPEVA